MFQKKNLDLLTVCFGQMMALLFLRHAWIVSNNDDDDDDTSAIFPVSRKNRIFLILFLINGCLLFVPYSLLWQGLPGFYYPVTLSVGPSISCIVDGNDR